MVEKYGVSDVTPGAYRGFGSIRPRPGTTTSLQQGLSGSVLYSIAFLRLLREDWSSIHLGQYRGRQQNAD